MGRVQREVAVQRGRSAAPWLSSSSWLRLDCSLASSVHSLARKASRLGRCATKVTGQTAKHAPDRIPSLLYTSLHVPPSLAPSFPYLPQSFETFCLSWAYPAALASDAALPVPSLHVPSSFPQYPQCSFLPAPSGSSPSSELQCVLYLPDLILRLLLCNRSLAHLLVPCAPASQLPPSSVR